MVVAMVAALRRHCGGLLFCALFLNLKCVARGGAAVMAAGGGSRPWASLLRDASLFGLAFGSGRSGTELAPSPMHRCGSRWDVQATCCAAAAAAAAWRKVC